MNVLYTAEATVEGGRKGHAKSSDGHLEVNLSSPKEMGGEGGEGTNPEQLFAAGYAACFQSAMMGIARREHLNADDSVITARVGIGQIGNGRIGLEVELIIKLPSIPDHAQAEDLVAKAHERCPYSNATRGNVQVTLTLI
ncbi:MAG: organic hydroperoxide resistance protein [Anaerolineae bacterium]|nr:organic hydroperoxide resistance protein [Anaerolineae bacterium]